LPHPLTPALSPSRGRGGEESGFRRVLAMLSLLALAACGVDPLDPLATRVEGGVTEAWRKGPPDCIALLPLKDGGGGGGGGGGDLRRALYGHLAPQGRRDVELKRVDVEAGRTGNHADLGRTLGCSALLTGHLVEDASQYLGVWSRVAVGAEVRVVRADDGVVLWTGRHTVASNGGAIPLSPIALAMGVYDAARNMGDRIRLSVIDRLAQDLVATIPDDVEAPFQDPASSPPVKAPPAKASPAITPRDQAERAFAAGDHAEARRQVDLALAATPHDGQALALKGRLLVHAGDRAGAEQAFLSAIAADPARADAYSALGALALERGETERAVAAFQMALEREPSSGFAYHHLGLALHEGGDAAGAATAHYGAGLAYLKAGDYGRAARSLRSLADLGAPAEDIRLLEQALARAVTGTGTGIGN
ncbi:MAG: tetratricopeptide repeat protein, partial [Alphaproteobacteria bacterium]